MDPLKKNEDGTPVRRSPFKTILNFRDLGQSINGLQSQMLVFSFVLPSVLLLISSSAFRQGRIFRGARASLLYASRPSQSVDPASPMAQVRKTELL